MPTLAQCIADPQLTEVCNCILERRFLHVHSFISIVYLPVWESTTSPGSLLQCLTTLSKKNKKCLLMSSLNLPWCSFELFPRILSLDPRKQSSASPSPRPPLRKLEGATRSPLGLLLSKLDKPRVLSRSSQDMPSSCLTSFVAHAGCIQLP